MFIFIGVFTGTVLETTGERIWGSMWRVESVSTLHTRKKLNCGKWVSLLFEINKNMSIAFSIFDFYTPIHMLRHIASYICFIITIVTPIFLKFLPLVGRHGSITTEGYLKITFDTKLHLVRKIVHNLAGMTWAGRDRNFLWMSLTSLKWTLLDVP